MNTTKQLEIELGGVGVKITLLQGCIKRTPGGYSHIFGIRGCAALAGHFFAKNP